MNFLDGIESIKNVGCTNNNIKDMYFYFNVDNISNEKFYNVNMSEAESLDGIKIFLEKNRKDVTDELLHRGYVVFERLRNFLREVSSSNLVDKTIGLTITDGDEEVTIIGSYLDILQECVKKRYLHYLDLTIFFESNHHGVTERWTIAKGGIQFIIIELVFAALLSLKYFNDPAWAFTGALGEMSLWCAVTDTIPFEKEVSFYYGIDHTFGKRIAREVSITKLRDEYYGGCIGYLLTGVILEKDVPYL